MATPVSMLPKVRSEALRRSAKGQPCSLRVASLVGAACEGHDTTVLCHLPVGNGGMGTKSSDISAAFGCSVCHDIIDGRDSRAVALRRDRLPDLIGRMLAGMAETQARWVEAGLLTVKDQEP